jgi:hypothetical protein
MSLDRMVLAVAKCVKCGAGYGKCGCWSKCSTCGWSYETGKQCRRCSGDSTQEIVAMTPRRKRKQKG